MMEYYIQTDYGSFYIRFITTFKISLWQDALGIIFLFYDIKHKYNKNISHVSLQINS
jgi:hypothetical protein